MHRPCLAIFLLIAALLSPFAMAGDEQIAPRVQATAGRLMDKALADKLAWRLLESLSTEIGPRLAGTEAEARARAWALKVLAEQDFHEPRIEPFGIHLWTRGLEQAAIVSPFAQSLVVTALGNSVATPAGGVEAEVVRFASVAELRAQPDLRLDGRILFIDEATARSRDGLAYLQAVPIRSQAAYEAGRRGALASVIRSIGTGSQRFAHAGGMRYARSVPKVPIGALSPPDADQLARALARGPVRLRLELETSGGGRSGNVWDGAPERLAPSGNVIAEIPGRSEELVLIGAHLDAWDLGTGAVDNAAGVATVIAAARLVAQLPGRPKRTVRVVLFGAEEVGAAGAWHYARNHAASLDRHVVALESDFGARRVWQLQTRWHESRRPWAAAVAGVLAPLGVELGNNEALGGPDLQFLLHAGVPIAALVQDGTDYYDVQHTANDTLDKVDPRELAQNVAAYAGFLYLATEAEGNFRGAVD